LRLSVVQAAQALDYTPNPHAQALARSVDAAIGVVVHDTGDPYFVEILRGILEPAERSGRMVMVCDTRRDPELEFAYVRHFRTQRVQALLLAGSGFEDREFGAQMTSEISAFERSGARVALIGRHHILGDSVVPENEDGAYEMTRALVDLGHTRFGVISGPPSLTTTQDRLAGIRRALAEAGIQDERICGGDFTRNRGARATEELLDADRDITAIFSLNDMMAIGALSVARERGLRVPEDISIAGFDDIPIAADLWPALSTVGVPMVEMGSERSSWHPDRTRQASRACASPPIWCYVHRPGPRAPDRRSRIGVSRREHVSASAGLRSRVQRFKSARRLPRG
jgi:LacI family transcriptional regulator